MDSITRKFLRDLVTMFPSKADLAIPENSTESSPVYVSFYLKGLLIVNSGNTPPQEIRGVQLSK